MKWGMVVFDLDGVLTAHTTSARQTGAMITAVRQFTALRYEPNLDGIPRHGRTDREVLGDLLVRMGRARGEASDPDLLLLYGEAYEPDASDSALRANALIVLQELRARGVTVAIATGNLEAIAEKKLRALGVDELVNIVGNGDLSTVRSEILRDVIGWSALPEEDVVYVCDTYQDVLAGHAAGVDCVIMPSDETREGTWIAEGIVANWQELHEWLARE